MENVKWKTRKMTHCKPLTNPASLLLVHDERSVVFNVVPEGGVVYVCAVHVGLELGEGDGRVAKAEARGDGGEVDEEGGDKLREE